MRDEPSITFVDTAPLNLAGGYERVLALLCNYARQRGIATRIAAPGKRLGDAISVLLTGRRVAVAIDDSARRSLFGECDTVSTLRGLIKAFRTSQILYVNNEPQVLLA